ncbi:MAG: right-handed parallel beta-helix repeat-containing protein [Gammaproteobacteria bacterium]
MRVAEFERAALTAMGAVLVCTALAQPANAATVELFSGQSFEAAMESLTPGDTLIVHAGTYYDSGRVAITVKGTADAPVVIKAAPGEARPRIGRRPTDPLQNTIDIVGATYLTISGLEITGNAGDGGDGINMSGGPSYITLEDMKIHDVSVGVNFRSSMHHITVRRSEIYDTNDTGEGLYIGCHEGDCVVRDTLIEGNWIHDTRNAEQGDGIEIKKGSHSIVVRDNVVHDTRYPCIIAYGTAGNPPNVIERNVVWNCDDAGMQVAADAVIRNNIIIPGTGGGLTSQDHNGVTPNNLQFTHNTIVGGSPCLRLNGWTGKTGLVFANNAVYCADGNYVVSGLSGVTAAGNVFSTAPPSFASLGYKLGRTAALDLTDPNARNVYPTATSTLIGAAATAWLAAEDFNGTSRNATADAGAYVRTSATNPGCAIVPGFKCAPVSPPPPPPAPQVSLTANPSSVAGRLERHQTANWLGVDWNARR